MESSEPMDIYQRISRNRLRLLIAASTFTAIIMALSGLGLFFLYSTSCLPFDFWMVLLLFWLAYLLYAILRYAFGGKWVFSNLKTVPPWKNDRRIDNALGAAVLASGMAKEVRLFVLPNPDINSFSLSLPDGSFALFTTQGMADKLPARERVAIIAHEIAHMQAGDTFLYTVMIRLVGPGTFNKMGKGWRLQRKRYSRSEIELPPAFALGYILAVSASLFRAGDGSSPLLSALSLSFLFLALAAFLPLLMHKLLQLVLDREREYHADMHAVYFTRNPPAVYHAIKSAAEDVRDLLLLPSYLDVLLFHPVVDYTSYRPFQTQPTMMDRLKRLRGAFPDIDI